MRLKVVPAHLSTSLLFSTVRISAYDNGIEESVGTGFFFRIHDVNDADILVTNKHVIEGAKDIQFALHKTSVDSGGYVELGSHERISTSPSDWLEHPDPTIDLCCWPVRSAAPSISSRGLFYRALSSAGIPATDEMERYPTSLTIAMAGYPNGLWDEKHGLPILRRGVTASHPFVPFNGRSEIVVDIACFPGSSGSPIVFDDRDYFASAFRFLGVLYAGPTISNEGEVLVAPIPTTSKLVKVDSMMNLGYAVSANRVLELAELARK